MSRRSLALLVAPLALLVGPAHAQQFGGALALHDGQIIVGESGNQTLAGMVYLFSEVDGRWTETGALRMTDELRRPDGFGRTLGLVGDHLIVGAPLESDGTGAAHVFQSAGSGQWMHRGTLPVPELTGESRFGSAVAISDEAVAISAPGANGEGRVFVFQRSADGSWEMTATVSPPPDATATAFGRSLAFSGHDLLVTSAGAARGETHVHAYRQDGAGEWIPRGRLSVEGLPEQSGFGSAIGVVDGVAYVGAPAVAGRSGRVFQFRFAEAAGSWIRAGMLQPLMEAPNTRFGSSITVADGALLIGAPGASGGAGSLYRFTGERGVWTNATTVTANGAPEGAALGGAAAAEDGLAVVAALGVDERSGAAFVYRRAADGTWTQRGMLANAARGFPAITGDEIHCVEGQASLFECKDVNITAFLPISALGGSRGTRVNDIWGWTDPQTGTEYAIVGRTNGTSFVDVSDPYDPVFVGDLPKAAGTRTTIWRDMKVYRDHVYIVADAAGEHGVQVFDLTGLRAFSGEPLALEETYRYDGIHSAHNIVINEQTGFAYAVGNSGGGETCGGGLHMINLENPARPEFVGCFAEPATGRRGTGYSHDAQCVIYRGPDSDHQGKEVCFGSNETALNIADVTNKGAPVSIATASYPSAAYAHQGWLTEDHTYFYMNDEGDEPQGLVEGTRTLVWDVTDLDDPILVKEHIAETTATDHNLYVKGDVMYQSNYSAGLRVLDISNPADPVEIGFFDTSPYEGGASWSNYPFFESGIIAVTGTGDGLFLLKNMARRNLVP